MEKQLLPPNPSRLIEGLRDTGYEFNTALADVIDNSVDAGATTIAVRIDMDSDGDIVVSVADNGSGMNREGLLNGMTYGAPIHADAKRLGKFGLGLKTASTAFCRKLSVISRDSASASALKATWDLDHVEKAGAWELLLGAPGKDEIAILNGVASGHAGTVVLWESVDRLLKNYKNQTGGHARNALTKVIDGFKDHAAMIYQRFLDPKDARARTVTMTVNGAKLKPWNPFCEDETETEMVAKDAQEVELPDGGTASFQIRAFVLPRREQFSSAEAAASAKIKNQNQGIYIYRENRLIHPADWLGMFRRTARHLIARGILVRPRAGRSVPGGHQEIADSSERNALRLGVESILTRAAERAQERYRKGQRKDVQKQAKDAHQDSNSNIGDKEADIKIADVTVVDPKTNEVEVKNKEGAVRLKLKINTESATGQVFVQTVDGIDDGLLWEPALVNGHHSVRINTGHPTITKSDAPNNSGVTMQGMDALLWALVEAELGT